KRRDEEAGPEFIALAFAAARVEAHVFVKTFVLPSYADIPPILNALREGYTIALIDIKVLKAKDVIELKRAISKIKKTVEALEGTIAGFGDNMVIATPSFAKVQKGAEEPVQTRRSDELERF
nr:cell division protein SepF [archaeon]